MQNYTKLLLIPCSGEETAKLAEELYKKLREDYGLENQVELLLSQRRREIPKEIPKEYRHPLVGDYFPDYEAQADIGKNELRDGIAGKHIALVEHLLTPDRKGEENSEQRVSVNDHIMTVRGFLEVMGKAETLQRTLVAPYLTYVRPHSIEKYEKRGFYQFDSLRMTLKDYQKGGINALLTIDPHSEKAEQIAKELGIDFHGINPFQSTRAINPYKLGLTDEKAKEIMKRLKPFQERFLRLKKENPNHLYLVSVDDGTEKRTEEFIEGVFPELSPEKVYALLVYLEKERVSYENTSTSFKPFSQINEKNIDKEGRFIIIDDMWASGGTAIKAGRILKEAGAKRVEVWVSHGVTMPKQYEKANNRQYVDEVVCLDTVPHSSDLKIKVIEASADLLAAGLYRVHQKLMASR